jgi:hypothetical protein
VAAATELRGASYRDRKWVDRYGWVWTWSDKHKQWSGVSLSYGPWGTCLATEDELSDYSLMGGRGPFLSLA